MLRKVLYVPPAMDGSPKLIASSLENDFIVFCGAIHHNSFDIFAHHVTKHENWHSDIRGYIEQDQTDVFSAQEPSMLMKFLRHVGTIINTVTKAKAKKQLPPNIYKCFYACMHTGWIITFFLKTLLPTITLHCLTRRMCG